MIPRRARRLLVARLIRGEPRRWLYYLALTSAWKRYKQLSGREPELIYSAELRRGQVLDVGASAPLPRRLRTKKVRQALVSSARAELAAAQDRPPPASRVRHR